MQDLGGWKGREGENDVIICNLKNKRHSKKFKKALNL